MKFYDPKGNPNQNIIKDFVKTYEDYYYLDGPEDKQIFKRLNRSSRKIEEVITEILDEGIKGEDEGNRQIAKILAWKIGKIDHFKSEKESNKVGKAVFKYQNGWENAEQLKGVNNRNGYPIEKAVRYIVKEKEELAKKDPKKFLYKLKDNDDFKGFGTVYMTTLLYFLTGNKYPIYDQFAHKAAMAIYLGVNPGEIYVAAALSKTEVDNYLRVYNEYCWLLKQIFGDYKISREKDRALWVYGHADIKKVSENKRYEYKMFDF